MRLCHGSLGAARGEVRAMLEGTLIQLRGDVHANVEGATLKNLRAEGGLLLALADGAPLALELGEKEAALWLRKINHPPSLAEKLGLAAGMPVHVHGQPAEIVRVLKAAGVQLVPPAQARLLFVLVDEPAQLQALQKLARARADGAQIWVLRPKGKGAAVREADIMALAKAEGLAPSKTAAWSEAYAADRYGSRKAG